MVVSAGSVYLFRCDQNGRDLPNDNNSLRDGTGKLIYPCGCPNHYFLVLSPFRANSNSTYDYSKMEISSEKNKIKQIKLCTVVPLDLEIEGDNQYTYTFQDTDLIENSNFIESKNKIQDFNKSSVLCDKICRINISKCMSQKALFYISEEAFVNIRDIINQFLNSGRLELKVNLEKTK